MADSRTNAGVAPETVRVICGDCREEIKKLDENSVHLIATDPPYGTDGMGENWDSEKLKKKVSRASVVGGLPVGMKFDVRQAHKIQTFFETVAKEALRVLRPGGFFLSFSSPRLSHRIAIALEQAGFEIRDMYAWHYKRGQGKAFGMDHFIDKMQKPQEEKDDIKQKIGGRQTAQLRPQFEPVIVAQKPRVGTLIENWLVWETGLVDLKNTRIDGRTPTTVLEGRKTRPRPLQRSFDRQTCAPHGDAHTAFLQRRPSCARSFSGQWYDSGGRQKHRAARHRHRDPSRLCRNSAQKIGNLK